MKINVSLLLLALSACADAPPTTAPADAHPDTDPNLTYTVGDAVHWWSKARCRYVDRCDQQALLDSYPGGLPECLAELSDKVCGAVDCTVDFPQTELATLARCVDSLSYLPCAADDFPTTCHDALGDQVLEVF